MTCVAIRKETGEAEPSSRFAPHTPKLWQEPGDAQWYLTQKYGQGAIADFEIVPHEVWLARKATQVVVEDVTEKAPEVNESEGLVIQDTGEGEDDGTA